MIDETSSSASTALAFFAHSGSFEGPSGLLLCSKSLSRLVSLVVMYLNLKLFKAVLRGMMFVRCKQMKSPEVKNLFFRIFAFVIGFGHLMTKAVLQAWILL